MDLYSLLHEMIPDGEKRLKQAVFTEEKLKMLDNESEKAAFVVLRNIASVGVKYEKTGIHFFPAFEWADGQRTFSVEDLTENDYQILYSLKLQELPLLIRARIAEILWAQKRDHNMANLACTCYYQLHLATFDDVRWPVCFKYLRNTVMLSGKISSTNYLVYLQYIYDKIVELNGEDKSFLSIKLIELLLEQKRWHEFSAIIPVIDKIILNPGNIYKARQAFEIKTRVLLKQGNSELATENNRNYACFLEENANHESADNIQSLFTAVQFLQDAIQLYRNNNAPEDGKRVHRKLVEIQKRITSYMIPVSGKADMTKIYQEVISLFDGLTLGEHIVRIATITPLYKEADLKRQVLEEATDPLSQLFSTGILSESGQVIANIEPIDVSNPEKKPEVLEAHMHQKAYFNEQIAGETILKWLQDLLNERFQFTKEDLQFLVEKNPIIPLGRERIFLSGLYCGMTGNLYESLHILAPQIENLFRYIAKECGAIMTTISSDNTSEEKTLRTVFDAPELKECYDNDILFLFKGLLNEKTGANIRNKIAHGLMSEKDGNGGASRFFFWWVVRLLSLTSNECHRILESESFSKAHEKQQ